jgi:hypothetical protein
MESLFYLSLGLVLALFALNLYLAIREEKRR